MAVYAVSAAVRAKGISNLKLYHFNWEITLESKENHAENQKRSCYECRFNNYYKIRDGCTWYPQIDQLYFQHEKTLVL